MIIKNDRLSLTVLGLYSFLLLMLGFLSNPMFGIRKDPSMPFYLAMTTLAMVGMLTYLVVHRQDSQIRALQRTVDELLESRA